MTKQFQFWMVPRTNIRTLGQRGDLDGALSVCFQLLAIICESQFVRWGLSQLPFC